MFRFHVLRCKNFACCWHCSFFCSRVLGSRSVAVLFHGISGPCLGCFSFFTALWHVFQPAYNSPLGLKASVVHDHCKWRYCGHRTSNWLNTLDVKGSRYPPLRHALCFRKHKLHLVTRIVDIHTLALLCAGVPTLSNLLKTVFYWLPLNSSAPAHSGCRNSEQQYQPHQAISFEIAAITSVVTRHCFVDILNLWHLHSVDISSSISRTNSHTHRLLGVVCCMRHQPSLAACVTSSPSSMQHVQH